MLVDLGAELAPLSWHELRALRYPLHRGAFDDLFCGMGGMHAAARLAGLRGNFSANHNNKAFLAHSQNFPDVEHLIGDISVLNPRRLPGVGDILLACPECRRHSRAGNWREAIAELDPWDPNREGERSRATMWCPQRMAAYRNYEYIILENVVEVVRWNQFRNGNWLKGWKDLGYEVEMYCFNSAFFYAPQSRDRVAFVIRRAGAPRPNLDFRPPCHCWSCEKTVFGIQSWKRAALRNRTPVGPAGKYGPNGQYLYTCPECRGAASPFITPARVAIDPSIPATRICDRPRPLRPKTMERLYRAWMLRGAVPQLTNVNGRDPRTTTSRPVWLPAMTQTTRAEIGLLAPHMVVPLRKNGTSRTTDQPAHTLCASGTHHAIVGPDQRGALAREAENQPVSTVTTKGNHMVLVGANRTNNHARDASCHPAATVTTAEGGSLFAVQTTSRDMLVQTGGNTFERPGSGYVRAWSLDAPSPTQSTSLERGVLQEQMILPPSSNAAARSAHESPAPTQVTTVRPSLLGVPPVQERGFAIPAEAMLTSYYGTSGPARSLSRQPAGTQTARDRHAVLIPAGGTYQQQITDVDASPSPTRMARDTYALSETATRLEECTFRMLDPKEAQALMDLSIRPDGQPFVTTEIAYDRRKRISISRSDTVRLAGNAVCQTLWANVVDRVALAREGVMVAEPGRRQYVALAR